MSTELGERLNMMDPVELNFGPIIQIVPTILAWSLANNLKETLLDRYEMVEGIPTPESPQPAPYFRLKEVK